MVCYATTDPWGIGQAQEPLPAWEDLTWTQRLFLDEAQYRATHAQAASAARKVNLMYKVTVTAVIIAIGFGLWKALS